MPRHDDDSPSDKAALRKFVLLLLFPFVVLFGLVGVSIGAWYVGAMLGFKVAEDGTMVVTLDLGLMIVTAWLIGRLVGRAVE